MADDRHDPHRKPPPLWSNPKPEEAPMPGACARCSAITRVLSDVNPRLNATPGCDSCALTGATSASPRKE